MTLECVIRGRARCVPDQTVNQGDPRSLTDNETRHLTCVYAAERIRTRSLPSWSCGFDSRHPLFFFAAHALYSTFFPTAVVRNWIACPLRARQPCGAARFPCSGCSRFQRRARLCPQVRMLPQPSTSTLPDCCAAAIAGDLPSSGVHRHSRTNGRTADYRRHGVAPGATA
jgi:hypothetical protein